MPLAKGKDRYQLGGKDNSTLGMKSSGHQRAFVLSFFFGLLHRFAFLDQTAILRYTELHASAIRESESLFGSRPQQRYYSLFFARHISSLMFQDLDHSFQHISILYFFKKLNNKTESTVITSRKRVVKMKETLKH